MSTSLCFEPEGVATFTDVYHYRDWILSTMGASAEEVARNTRLRRTGCAVRGTLGMGCVNPHGTRWGPMDVRGVELGANCRAGQTQTVLCSIEPGYVVINRFTMTTTTADGTVTAEELPFSSRWASYFGVLPEGARHEFACQVGLPAFSGGIGGIALRF